MEEMAEKAAVRFVHPKLNSWSKYAPRMAPSPQTRES
jgi:hypothetical protein